MPGYRLELLGNFGLFGPSGERIEITSRKSIAMIALLALSASGARSRKWLQSMLWGSREEEQAQSSLRRELSNLAQRLAAQGAGSLLFRNHQRVALAVEQLQIDILDLGTRVQVGPAVATPPVFLEGLDLPDCDAFEDWLREERSRIAQLAQRSAASAPAPPPVRDVLGSGHPSRAELLGQSAPRLPPKPSLAVLPLEELAPSDGWLGPAMAEELGMILSQFPQLFIVASSAARAIAASGLSRPELARQLGVRYLVEGSLLKVGNHLRVAVALLEGSTGEQIWAERFAGTTTDMFDLQRDIATRIAPQIWSKVDSEERRAVLRRSAPPADRYELYWRANALFRSWKAESVAEAIVLAEQLVADDPACPWATSLAGFCHSIALISGFAVDAKATRHRAVSHYQAAIRHGGDNVEALGYAAGTLLNIGGELPIADRLIARALNLLPAHQPTLFWGGWVDVAMGNAQRARERFELAVRINPATSNRGQTLAGMGFAALQQGAIDEAGLFFEEALLTAPDFPLTHIGLCVTSMLRGDRAAASASARRLRADGALGFLALFNPDQQQLLRQAIAQAESPPA